MTEISKTEWDGAEENTVVWYQNSGVSQLLVYFDSDVYGHILKRTLIKDKREKKHERFFRLTEEEIRDMILPRII